MRGESSGIDASDDGRFVVVGTETGEIRLYDANTGRKLRDFRRQSASINDVRFAVNNRFVLSAQEDGTARLWDIGTGDELASLIMIDNGHSWLVVTPEGLYDSSSAENGSVAFWVANESKIRSFEIAAKNHRYPGLLPALVRGERPLPPPLNSSVRLAPSVVCHEPVKVKAAQNAGWAAPFAARRVRMNFNWAFRSASAFDCPVARF